MSFPNRSIKYYSILPICTKETWSYHFPCPQFGRYESCRLAYHKILLLALYSSKIWFALIWNKMNNLTIAKRVGRLLFAFTLSSDSNQKSPRKVSIARLTGRGRWRNPDLNWKFSWQVSAASESTNDRGTSPQFDIRRRKQLTTKITNLPEVSGWSSAPWDVYGLAAKLQVIQV